MDLFLDTIPSELLEFLAYTLNNNDLLNFLQLVNTENIVWPRIFEYHFGLRKKVLSKDDYIRYLNVERFKEKLEYVDKIKKITVDDLINLINLEILELSGSRIREIPQEIGNLINLKQITFHNNQIQEVPKEIGGLFNLESLYLSYNQIQKIPSEIGNLSK